MKRLLAGVALVALSGIVNSAHANALHGYCSGCFDNGTNTPTTSNPLINFGFSDSGGPETGGYTIDILGHTLGDVFNINGTINGASVSGSSTFKGVWSSGDLDSFLGFSANPNNPIGAYADGGSSFDVYQVNFGTRTLFNDQTHELLSILEKMDPGSYVVAYLDPPGTATANSAALFAGVSQTPLPGTLILLGSALGLGGLWRKLRGKVTAA